MNENYDHWEAGVRVRRVALDTDGTVQLYMDPVAFAYLDEHTPSGRTKGPWVGINQPGLFVDIDASAEEIGRALLNALERLRRARSR